MNEPSPSGTEHLFYCLRTLEDVSAQLLGAPEEAIESIRRSGRLTPFAPVFPQAYGESGRDEVAGARIELLKKLESRREALESAAGGLRDILGEGLGAPSLEEKLLPGDKPQ